MIKGGANLMISPCGLQLLGRDIMIDSPSKISSQQLNELSISLKK